MIFRNWCGVATGFIIAIAGYFRYMYYWYDPSVAFLFVLGGLGLAFEVYNKDRIRRLELNHMAMGEYILDMKNDNEKTNRKNRKTRRT